MSSRKPSRTSNSTRSPSKKQWWIKNCSYQLLFQEIPPDSVDLVFADPPFNIGMKYDTHDDKMSRLSYRDFTASWISCCVNALRPGGSMVVAINDENAALIYTMLEHRGMTLRNWIIWHFTFGPHLKKKFGRNKTHLLYFVRPGAPFTFNDADIRIKSVRQKIGDKRADPNGRVPGDVWTMSRVCGTFKERTGHPCQMPESVLERIIKATTNEGDLVVDPFGGSFTTAAVAVRYGRQAISCDISADYCKDGRKRIAALS